MAKFRMVEVGDSKEFTTASGETISLIIKRIGRFERVDVAELLTRSEIGRAERLLMRESITAWNGVEDEKGRPVKFSIENLNAVLGQDPDLGRQVSDHLFELNGFSLVEGEKEKEDSDQNPLGSATATSSD